MNKFNRVMDHGTPRLVTKNRQLNMNPGSLGSRNLLMNLASARNGELKATEAGPKKEFNTNTISNFRKKMMEEEKAEMEEMSKPQKPIVV